MLSQVKSIFDDQQKIDSFSGELDKFLSKVSLGGGDDEGDEEDGGEGEEEEAAAVLPDPNTFVVPPKLIDEAGGAPLSPHPPDTT